MSEERDWYYLADYTHICYDKEVLNAKTLKCVKHELKPIFRDITVEEIRKIGKDYLPIDWNGDIATIKQKYNDIIKVIDKYENIILIFEEENYFSLFNVKKEKQECFVSTQFITYDMIFPFNLYLEFEILTKNDEKKICDITIVYEKFSDKIIIKERVLSDTLILRSEFDLGFIGNDEIAYK